MKFPAAREIPILGEPIEINLSIEVYAKLVDANLAILRPHLSTEEERHDCTIGPATYTVERIEIIGNEPTLLLRHKPKRADDIEDRFKKLADMLGPERMAEIRRDMEKPPIDPKTGLDPADYIYSRFPYEIRMPKAAFDAGIMDLYFENDNKGIVRRRDVVLDKNGMKPDALSRLTQTLANAVQMAGQNTGRKPDGADGPA